MEHASLAAWSRALITAPTLEAKLGMPSPVGLPLGEADPADAQLRPSRPGLVVVEKQKFPRRLGSVENRIKLLHTFAHHELQAAELMAWAILAFDQTPESFRRGLARIAMDELRHLGLYDARLRELGSAFGALPVRDWFWARVPSCGSPKSFVACLGVGFEGGNLDHAQRFEHVLSSVGDEASAQLQVLIGREEIAHVRFAAKWFAEFGGRPLRFDDWCEALPAPLSPLTMRGNPIDRESRAKAGLSDAFVQALAAWEPEERP